MSNELHQTGEEYIMKQVFRQDLVSDAADVEIGVYDNATDGLSDGSNVGDITTEPQGSAYSRGTASLDSTDIGAGQNADSNYEITLPDVTYDVSDSSGSADAYFVTVTFQSDVAGDSGASENLFWTGNLDDTYDIGSVDEFTLQDAGLAID